MKASSLLPLAMGVLNLLGLVLAASYVIMVVAAHAEPITVSRTMTWQQWRNIMAKCHVRAAGPITFPTVQPMVGTVISIFFSGEPEQIRCADMQLGVTPTP